MVVDPQRPALAAPDGRRRSAPTFSAFWLFDGPLSTEIYSLSLAGPVAKAVEGAICPAASHQARLCRILVSENNAIGHQAPSLASLFMPAKLDRAHEVLNGVVTAIAAIQP